jgi:hypothetical protein
MNRRLIAFDLGTVSAHGRQYRDRFGVRVGTVYVGVVLRWSMFRFRPFFWLISGAGTLGFRAGPLIVFF